MGKLWSIVGFITVVRTVTIRTFGETVQSVVDTGIQGIQMSWKVTAVKIAVDELDMLQFLFTGCIGQAFDACCIAGGVRQPSKSKVGIVIGQTTTDFVVELSGSALHETGRPAVLLEDVHVHIQFLQNRISVVIVCQTFSSLQLHILDNSCTATKCKLLAL